MKKRAYITLKYLACRIDIHEVSYSDPAELAELTPDDIKKFPKVANSDLFTNSSWPRVDKIVPTIEEIEIS